MSEPPAASVPAAGVLSALKLVREGRILRLAKARYPGMPLWPGHPPFMVMSYRTPRGLRAQGTQPWGPGNDAQLGYVAELTMGTQHTGAHIDAHGHITLGEAACWHGGGGGNADEHLGDFGLLKGDATEIAPIWTRAVLYDVPGHRGVASLEAGEAVGPDEFAAIEAASGVAPPGSGDVVLVRTGYLSHWPDEEALAAHRGAGPDIAACRRWSAAGVLAVGSDTETFEVQPAPEADRGEPANPQPVHSHLLVEHGIYIMESLDLEGLAATGAREFLFVALPLAIQGATGSMIDPVAVL